MQGWLTKLILILVIIMTQSYAKRSEKILCFGNSITDKGSWSQIVEQKSSYKTINAGLSGRKVAEGKQALQTYLSKYNDLDKIIIFLGVNDLPSRDQRPGVVKVAKCVTDMNKIINLALTRFDPQDIILAAPCGVNPNQMSQINLRKGYNVVQPLLAKMEQDYKTLAKQKGISFLSLFGIVSDENYKDGLHPNKAGNQEIARAVLQYLKSGEQK